MANSYNTNLSTVQANAAAYLARLQETAADTPTLGWQTGANIPAPNAPGIGVISPFENLPGFDNNTAAGTPKDSNWTLLDQEENARTPQKSGYIGYGGFVDRDPEEAGYVPWPSSGGNSTPRAGGNNDIVSSVANPDNLATGTPDPSGYPAVEKAMWIETLAAGWIEDPTP